MYQNRNSYLIVVNPHFPDAPPNRRTYLVVSRLF